jgi:hypothetical protein
VNREYRWAWPGGVRTSEMRSSQREAASRAPAASPVCSRAHANAPTAPKLCAPASIRSAVERASSRRSRRLATRGGGTMCSRPDRATSDSAPRRSPRRPHRRAPVPARSCARALEPATRVDNQSPRQQIAEPFADPQPLVEPLGASSTAHSRRFRGPVALRARGAA